MYKNMKRSESTEQMTLIDWCNINTCAYPELELIYHIPNEGKRSDYQGKKLKREGLKKEFLTCAYQFLVGIIMDYTLK